MKTKSFIKIISAVTLAVAACLTVSHVSAQTVLAGWDVSGLASSGPSPFAPTTSNPNLTVGGLTRGPGVVSTATGNVWGGNNWTNTGVAASETQAINGGKYVTFTIQANSGSTVSVTNISKFFVTKSATGPASGELQWSIDGTTFNDFTSLSYGAQGTAISAQSIGTFSLLGISALQNVSSGTTVTIRIVNWGATSTGGTWYIGNSTTAGSDFEIQGAVVSSGGPTAPTITGISPSSIATNSGGTATFTLTSTSGNPVASNFWYKISGGTTNLVAGATATSLTFSPAAISNTASYFAILTNASGSATSSVVSLTVTDAPPSITGIGPASLTVNAGLNASFTVTNTGTPPFGYSWYQETALATNLIADATNATLTLSNVLGSDAGNYQVVITNSTALSVTSTVVSLTVTNDPHIVTQPASAHGLISNTVQFSVGAVGSAPAYQWYFADSSGNIISAVSDGPQGSGSGIFGSTGSTLTITNLQNADLTNFVVTVTNAYGAVTSSVASLLSVDTTAEIAFWDFNGPEFTNTVVNPNSLNNPVPFLGVGSAAAVGTTFIPPTSPFSGSVDPNDGLGFTSHLPPFSWGTSTYPSNGVAGGNKTSGVQFNVSTVGAKNIKFSYESRGSGTASKYERVQYTTNGVDWVDYPASSVFSSITVSWYPFSYDFTGFPGVANNPNFGVRIVTEYQSTATYGVSTNANFAAIANNYGTSGTLTYDLVTFNGDAITSANQPPTVSGFMNTNMVDYLPLTNNFTVGDDSTAPDSLTYSAVSLNPSSFNPTFEFIGSGVNRKMIIHPNSITQTVAAAPILVTVTDANGDSTAAWFTVTVGTVNLPPTSSLVTVSTTNMLANTNVVIPFTVGDDRTPTNGQSFSYNVSSGNTTLIPNDSVNNLIISNITPTNLTFTVIPAINQVGLGVVNVTVNDNDLDAPKSTTATIPFMVRPNTNVVMIDYFNYDTAGALDVAAGGFWQHLSGNLGQMQVSGGVVTVDTFNSTENLQTPLLGAPYKTNSGAVLYASYIVNMANPANMPRNNGTYFSAFNDGSGTTANVEGLVVVATNGVTTPGDYRLGIANLNGATASNSTMFAQDLLPNTSYVVVVQLVLSNGVATLWINPTNQSSPSVTDTGVVPTKFNISDFELRESGANGGAVSVSHLLVGTTFNSVIYPPLANPDNYAVTENSVNDVLNPLTNDVSGGTLSLVSVSPDGNGTATILNGTNVQFTPTAGFTGMASIGYTATDDLGGTSSSTITVTVAAPSTIVPTVPPGITGLSFINGNLVITGTNAQATGVYYLLSSTNVALPLSQWTPVATNVVGTDNGFTFTGTNVVTPGSQGQFYILSSTNFQ